MSRRTGRAAPAGTRPNFGQLLLIIPPSTGMERLSGRRRCNWVSARLVRALRGVHAALQAGVAVVDAAIDLAERSVFGPVC